MPIIAINVSFVRLDGNENSIVSQPEVPVDAVTAVSSVQVVDYTYIPKLSVSNSDGFTAIECPALILNFGKFLKTMVLLHMFLCSKQESVPRTLTPC